MPGFSGATGVPLKQMQDAIAQSTAKTMTVYNTSTGIITTSIAPNKFVSAHTINWGSVVGIAVTVSDNKVVLNLYRIPDGTAFTDTRLQLAIVYYE